MVICFWGIELSQMALGSQSYWLKDSTASISALEIEALVHLLATLQDSSG